MRYFLTQKNGRNTTSLVSIGISPDPLKTHHLGAQMFQLRILVSMVILTRSSTICWVEDVEIRVIDRPLAALMILAVAIVLKLPHQILKRRSHSPFPKHFTVSSNGSNSTMTRLTSAFPQGPNQVVEFGSKVEVVPVRSRNSGVTCI
jgi:hypothetical protein